MPHKFSTNMAAHIFYKMLLAFFQNYENTTNWTGIFKMGWDELRAMSC